MDTDKLEAPGALAGATEGMGKMLGTKFTPSRVYFANAESEHPTAPAFPILARHWPGFPTDYEGGG